jgi:hypothetical protein
MEPEMKAGPVQWWLRRKPKQKQRIRFRPTAVNDRLRARGSVSDQLKPAGSIRN